MSRAQAIEADLTWTGDRFERGVVLEIGGDGRIAEVLRPHERGARHASDRSSDRAVRRLRGRALLPGFVNSHSHAFQRGLRGRGETFPHRSGSFWTWREAMYGLIERLDGPTFLRLTVQAFREMRAAGITTVGEFHYLHHSPAGFDFALDELVGRAATSAGIRLVLLQAFYATGGVGKPLTGSQLRFRTATLDEYWQSFDEVLPKLRLHSQTAGVVAHSVRAAHPDEIATLAAEAKRRGLPFHLHLEEQRQEVEDCRAAYGLTPMGVVLSRLEHLDHVTAVHCTHTEPAELVQYFERGGRACLCPLTEGNLGDGIASLDAESARHHLALGSDSNARISHLEEMRWLEYAQRLRGEKRGALRDVDGAWAPVALHAATEGGAAALGIEAGKIAVGKWADLVALDLGAPALDGADEDTLLAQFLCGAGDDVIAETAVAGAWLEHRNGSEAS